MKKVAILTNFSSLYQAYSLCIVVERQVKALTLNGYKPKVIVMDGFKPEGAFTDPNVELCYMPRMKCSNEWKKDETFDFDVKRVKEKLLEYLQGVDVVLTHDLFYQAAMQKYDAAARQVAKIYPKIRWLHWIHSATSSRDRGEKFPNSLVVYPNSFDIPRVARAFGYEEDEVKVVPHAIDVCRFFNMHPLSEKIIRKNNILQADVIMTYPLRLDRGKQPEYLIKIASALKRRGKTAKIIYIDFHSTGGDKAKYREELKKQAIENGFRSSDVIFTSEQDPKLKLECPREMVKDFMEISNVFCLPSKSETFSYVAQEAAITGNFMILNYDFPAMRSIYGKYPTYKKFSSNVNISDGMDGETTTTYENENAYFDDIASYICYELEHDRIMAMRSKIRKEHNLQAVFKKYMEPLFQYEEMK